MFSQQQIQACLERLSSEQRARYERMSDADKRTLLQRLMQPQPQTQPLQQPQQQQQQQQQPQRQQIQYIQQAQQFQQAQEQQQRQQSQQNYGQQYQYQYQQRQQQQQTQLWYRVYRPENGRGDLHHVTGDIIGARGMRYERRSNWTPGQSANLRSKIPIGYVLRADYNSGRVSAILAALPTPPKQQGLNFWEKDPITGRYELTWVKEDGELYAPGEKRRPIFKCNEWTAEYAIPALQDAGILRRSTN